jgi:histidine triad (HIT) family protein
MTIFSKIIAGQIPCYIIAEDERYFAFLDINPLNEGHTLVIPKKEVDYIFDLEEADYTGLMAFARKTALALKKAVPCLRIGMAVVGLEVPHVHVHLIPLHTAHDIDFGKAKLKLSAQEFEKIAEKIRKELN